MTENDFTSPYSKITDEQAGTDPDLAPGVQEAAAIESRRNLALASIRGRLKLEKNDPQMEKYNNMSLENLEAERDKLRNSV